MNDNIELELKTLVNEKDFYQLLCLYPNYQIINQTNYYYIDEKKQIRNLKAVLRERIINDDKISTFKIKRGSNLFEYEYPGDIYSKEMTKILEQNNISYPYNLICSLTTKRHLINLPFAQLCLDINYYNNIVDYEIEYEVTSVHDYVQEFTNILNQANIIYQENPYSKFLRAINSI
ncbi:MAG: CYTH domain-containing protein [Erysipelotrichaceae bacterium]